MVFRPPSQQPLAADFRVRTSVLRRTSAPAERKRRRNNIVLRSFSNIAISGRIAAGSSSLARVLSEKLGWKLRDGGQIFRDISQQRGFDLEKNPQQYGDDVDWMVDEETTRLLRDESNIVVTSKLAGFLSRDIKTTLRVLLTCPLDVRIRRYAQHRRYTEQEAKRLIELREKEDQEKFIRLYGEHDFFDPVYFTLWLSSDQLPIKEEVEDILEELSKHTDDR